MTTRGIRAVDILLVEDSATDAELMQLAMQQSDFNNAVHHVRDGEQAMAFLRQEGEYADAPRPDLILLDLNMPRMDGREVLRRLRNDDDLKVIPVVVLTTSAHDKDVLESYGLYANSYVVKPVDLKSFFTVFKQIHNFWLQIVALPFPKEQSKTGVESDLDAKGNTIE